MNNSAISTKRTVFLAMLIALEIIISRFFSINTLTIKIGFGFIVIAVMGMIYGPLYAGIGAGISDFLGALLFPTGPYFFGFTLTAIATGVLYGWFLNNRKVSFAQICLVVITSYALLSLLLNTYWLSLVIPNSSMVALFPLRILQAFIMVPLQIIGISAISVPIESILKKQLL